MFDRSRAPPVALYGADGTLVAYRKDEDPMSSFVSTEPRQPSPYAVRVPSASVPSASVPSASVPSASVPSVRVPAAFVYVPSVRVPSARVPSVSVPVPSAAYDTARLRSAYHERLSDG